MRVKVLEAAVAAASLLAVSASAQDLVVRIGHAANVSGFLSDFGRDSEDAARLAVDDLNARGVTIGGRKARFELVTADDKFDPRQAAVAAQALVDAGVAGVVGHLFSGLSIAAAKVYCAAGIPQISPGSTATEYTRSGCRSTLRVAPNDVRIGGELGRYAVKEMRARRVAVVDDGSVAGKGMAESFAAAVTAAGGHVVATHSVSDKTRDFSELLGAIGPKKPDLLFFTGNPLQGGPLIKQMKALGLNARVMSAETMCQADLPARAGDAWVDSQVVCEMPGGAEFGAAPMGRFRVAYKQHFGRDPLRVPTPFAYDAVEVMADAMQRAGSAEPAKFVPALLATRGYPGITGTIGVDEHGERIEVGLTLFGFKNRLRDPIATIP